MICMRIATSLGSFGPTMEPNGSWKCTVTTQLAQWAKFAPNWPMGPWRIGPLGALAIGALLLLALLAGAIGPLAIGVNANLSLRPFLLGHCYYWPYCWGIPTVGPIARTLLVLLLFLLMTSATCTRSARSRRNSSFVFCCNIILEKMQLAMTSVPLQQIFWLTNQ